MEYANMSLALFIISVVLAILGFGSQRFRIKSPKWKYTILGFALLSAVLGYGAGIESDNQQQLVHDKAVEASVQADRAHAQINEIRTPRRMEPEAKRMLVARLKPYAGQKYDMKVFGNQDSLELAQAIQTILEEAGWVYTNVYPKHSTRRYAETRDNGVWVMSGKEETKRTSETRMALHRALNEVGLYDDSPALTPKYCVESTGPIQEGTKLTPIPCSESPIQSIEVVFTIRDDVIPDDALVLHVGKERL